MLDAMVRELVSCSDDDMDHPAEVEVVLDLAVERGVVVVVVVEEEEDLEEGKERGNAKGEDDLEEAVATVVGVG